MSLNSSSSPEGTDRSFEGYRNLGGSLTEELYQKVVNASYTEEDYAAAVQSIQKAGFALPDHSFIAMMACIIHVLGHEHQVVEGVEGKLIPETYMFLERP